jgi:TonB family protein
MQRYLVRGCLAAVVAVLVGCASGPSEAEWPETLTGINDMQAITPWRPQIPLPAMDKVRDRSRSSKLVLQLLVLADGRVLRARVSESSGNPVLDEAAMLSARLLRFIPYQANGVAEPVSVLAPMSFPFYDRPR